MPFLHYHPASLPYFYFVNFNEFFWQVLFWKVEKKAIIFVPVSSLILRMSWIDLVLPKVSINCIRQCHSLLWGCAGSWSGGGFLFIYLFKIKPFKFLKNPLTPPALSLNLIYPPRLSQPYLALSLICSAVIFCALSTST